MQPLKELRAGHPCTHRLARAVLGDRQMIDGASLSWGHKKVHFLWVFVLQTPGLCLCRSSSHAQVMRRACFSLGCAPSLC